MKRNVLKEILDETEISQRQLARILGYNVSYINRVIARKQVMGITLAVKVAQMYGYELDFIIENEDVQV